MASTAVPAWLRRRDPGLAIVRRAARVAVVACVGFYACRYGLRNPALAGGVQLLYILPCFPPYDPGSLGYRPATTVRGSRRGYASDMVCD